MGISKVTFSFVFLSLLMHGHSIENKTNETSSTTTTSTDTTTQLRITTTTTLKASATKDPLRERNVTTGVPVELNVTETTTTDSSNTDSSAETPTTSAEIITTLSSTTSSSELPTTVKPTTTPAPFNHSEFVYGHYCTCDLTRDACDANCCCDVDCSERDVKVFSGCLRAETYDPDPRYCFRTEILAENNTQFLIERRSTDRLFCISVDNLRDGFRYREHEPVENVTDFIELTSRHKAYVRPDDRTFEIRLNNSNNRTDPEEDADNEDISNELNETSDYSFSEKSYLMGRPIWTYRRDLKAPGLFALPTDRDCNSVSPIRYGQDSEISCFRGPVLNCSEIPHISASEFFDFSVIRSPAHFRNRTDRFVEISVRVCTAKTCSDLHENGHGPIHRVTSGCDNVVTSARYVITHDGIKGIKNVAVTIELANFSSIVESNEEPFFSQTFGYTHFWSSDNSTEISKRSGNPGYQRGKPVLMGNLKKNETGTNWFIDRYPDPFMTIMKTHLDCSSADPSERFEVKFGENVRTGCSFQLDRSELFERCDVIKNQIIGLLAGFDDDILNSTSKSRKIGGKFFSDRRVAVFGNSEMSKPGDWVQVMFSNVPTLSVTSSKSARDEGVCKNMVTSLHIEIAYANAGSFANPQAKIVGVHYRFSRPEDVVFRCVGLACRLPKSKALRIEVSTSVAFLDISEPATERYAEYPVIEARLPHDFFYPFVTSSASKIPASTFALHFILLLLATISVIF